MNKTESCWNWTGPVIGFGYGRIRVGGRSHAAHRFAYELLVGPIPSGLQLDHLCRNTRCVNPEHLEPVTAKVNTMRSGNLAATNAKKATCANGHGIPLVEVASGRPQRQRVCVECRRASWRRFAAKKYEKVKAARTLAALASDEKEERT